jgi:hypothetical protein
MKIQVEPIGHIIKLFSAACFIYGEESRELSGPTLDTSLLLLKQIDDFLVSMHGSFKNS